jgi:uncharacterized protein (TIGR03086 family)
MDIISALESSYDQTAKLVANLEDADMGLATPCAGWDLRAVLNHLAGMVSMFTLVNRGHPAGEDAGDITAEGPSVVLAQLVRDNLGSWRAPGAFEGQRTYPFGSFPAEAAALVNLEEVSVHNWDLARASGQDASIEDEVAMMVYEFCRSIPLDAYRATGAFGPEVIVAKEAPLTDRLVGLLGRRP